VLGGELCKIEFSYIFKTHKMFITLHEICVDIRRYLKTRNRKLQFGKIITDARMKKKNVSGRLYHQNSLITTTEKTILFPGKLLRPNTRMEIGGGKNSLCCKMFKCLQRVKLTLRQLMKSTKCSERRKQNKYSRGEDNTS